MEITSEIWISDKTLTFEEASVKGLFKIIVSDKENKESIPLLLDDFQIKQITGMLAKSKFEPNMPFNYFKLLIAGCAKYAITKCNKNNGE